MLETATASELYHAHRIGCAAGELLRPRRGEPSVAEELREQAHTERREADAAVHGGRHARLVGSDRERVLALAVHRVHVARAKDGSARVGVAAFEDQYVLVPL